MTGAPSGSADVSATGRVRALWPDCAGLVVGVGLTVGNRPAALPLGLSVGATAGMLGRLPTGSAEVTGSGEVTASGTVGSSGRFCGVGFCSGTRLCGGGGF
jgi:hypothetical protein